MDPVEIIEMCRVASERGAPSHAGNPYVFTSAEYEQAWRRDPRKVRALLDEIICGEHVHDGLELLLRFGVFKALIPELCNIKNLGDADGLHKDVWTHTKNVVSGVPASPDLRWGALFHDIGKSATRRFIDGKVTFHNHDIVGARMVDGIQHRIGLFNDDPLLYATVKQLVLEHLRPASYKATWTDSAVRRLISECGDKGFFEKLMLLSRADLTTKQDAKRRRALAKAAELEERVKLVIASDNAPKLPKGTMGIIISRLGKPPGKWANDVRLELEQMMSRGILKPTEDVDYYVKAGVDVAEAKWQDEQPVIM